MRVVRLGFELRVELLVDGSDVWVQTTKDTADRLGIDAGSTIHVRASAEAIRPGQPLPSSVPETVSIA